MEITVTICWQIWWQYHNVTCTLSVPLFQTSLWKSFISSSGRLKLSRHLLTLMFEEFGTKIRWRCDGACKCTILNLQYFIHVFAEVRPPRCLLEGFSSGKQLWLTAYVCGFPIIYIYIYNIYNTLWNPLFLSTPREQLQVLEQKEEEIFLFLFLNRKCCFVQM